MTILEAKLVIAETVIEGRDIDPYCPVIKKLWNCTDELDSGLPDPDKFFDADMSCAIFAAFWTRFDVWDAPELLSDKVTVTRAMYVRQFRRELIHNIELKRQAAERDARVANIPLREAVRDISRAAHRHRDTAKTMWDSGAMYSARYPAQQKRECYALKERGIVVAHKQGLLRYMGQSPQGLAVYEYGEGGLLCFHSYLHPRGVDRPNVANHPEILFVAAQELLHQEEDVRYLSQLPEPGDDYDRVSPSRHPREERAITCWSCGEEGHVARDCPNGDDGGSFADHEW